MYSKSATAQREPDADTFIKYRDAALQRARIAVRLGIDRAIESDFGDSTICARGPDFSICLCAFSK